jgi:cyclohexanecarboxyl-CoA dehydrogenase
VVFFTENQQKFRSEVQAFAARELARGAKERAKLDCISEPVIKKLAGAKLLGLTTPTEFGGRPADSVMIGIMFEELCKVDFSPMLLLLSHVMVPLMMKWASEELSEEWLPQLARGEKLVCFGNTEPECGSDATAIRTRAVYRQGSYVLTGEKTSVSVGMQADAMALTAVTREDAGARGITCFLVPLDMPGVSRSRFSDMGCIPAGRASIFLNDVRVSPKYRIGEEGEGFVKVMTGFDITRALVVLAALGLAEASLSEASEHVKRKTLFGVPIGHYEGVAFKLAECATWIEASKLLSYQALKLRDEGLPHTRETAMAKWFASESATNAIHEILLIFGTDGYSETNAIEQRLRDAIGLLIGDGTSEIMKLIIARDIIGKRFMPVI